MSLGIGFPLVDPTVPSPFFLTYAAMQKPDSYSLFVPQWAHGRFNGSIADARNEITRQAIDAGCEYLWMIDTDQTYPEDTLPKLLAHNVDICGASVHSRWEPYRTFMLRGEPGKYLHVGDEVAYSGDLVEVDATGTGCLLIKTSVFEKIPYPWFEFSRTEDGKPVGEDINFCSKARKAGIKVHVDSSIEVGHLAVINIGRWTHELWKAANK